MPHCRTSCAFTFSFLVLATSPWPAPAAEKTSGSIVSIQHQGMLVRECTLEGETRKDGVVPRDGNGLQLSRDRWLVVYNTHGWRGVDDERSIVYQVRRDAPDGPVLKEGWLVRTRNDWLPFGVAAPPAGKSYVKQHGHMVAFGVPKGVFIDGKPERPTPTSSSPSGAWWPVCWTYRRIASKRRITIPSCTIRLRTSNGCNFA